MTPVILAAGAVKGSFLLPRPRKSGLEAVIKSIVSNILV